MENKDTQSLSNPRVTVAMPVYNVEPYVARSIMSVLDQDYDNIEILILYDESTDNSLQVIKDTLEGSRFPKRVIINEAEKKSIGIARNILLDNYQGDYLYFLDSDDFIEPNTIESMVKEALISDADIVGAGHQSHDENGNVINIYQYSTKTVCDSKQLRFNTYVRNVYYPIYAWNKLFKSSFLRQNEFRFRFNHHEDALFSFLEMEVARRVVLLPMVTYNYLVRKNSLTRMVMTLEKAEIFITIRDFVYNRYLGDNGIIGLCAKIDYFIMCYIMTVRDSYMSNQISSEDKQKLCNAAFNAPKIPVRHFARIIKSKRYKVILTIVVSKLPFTMNMILVKCYQIFKKIPAIKIGFLISC